MTDNFQQKGNLKSLTQMVFLISSEMFLSVAFSQKGLYYYSAGQCRMLTKQNTKVNLDHQPACAATENWAWDKLCSYGVEWTVGSNNLRKSLFQSRTSFCKQHSSDGNWKSFHSKNFQFVFESKLVESFSIQYWKQFADSSVPLKASWRESK